MKTTLPFIVFFFLVFFAGISQSAQASHAAGCELQYQCIGLNQYKIILKFYRDCTGIAAPSNPSVQITSPGCGSNTINLNLIMDPVLSCGSTIQDGCEVSPSLCSAYLAQTGCNYTGTGQPPYPGIKVYVYSNTVTLPYACSAWKVRFTESARNPSSNLVNASGNNLSIESIINNSTDSVTGQAIQNNSVKFANLPVFMVCVNSPTWYNHGAFDSDGDSLVFSLITPLGNNYTPMTFAAGWTVTQPIRTNPAGSLSFSSTNGQLPFTPSNQEVDVLAVQVNEYRKGVLVGSTVRDMQIYVLNCVSYLPEISNIENASGCMLSDTNTVNICYGANASFSITAQDPAHSVLTLTSDLQNSTYLSSNMATSQTGAGDSVTFNVQWTSQTFSKGCHTFLLTATNHNCPVTGSLTKEFKVCIDTGLQVYSSAPLYCGSPVKLSISGGSNVTWKPAEGLSDSTAAAPWAYPVVPTTYVVTSTCGTDSVFIDTAALRQVDAGYDTVVCGNAPVLLNALYNTSSVSKTVWSASAVMADSLMGVPGYNTASIVYTNLSTSAVYFHAEYTDGCIVYDSVLVTEKPIPDIKANTAKPVSCPNVSGNILIASVNGYCGTVNAATCATPSILTVGTGTSVIPPGNPTQYPTIYGNYKKSARHQFLYKATELNALNGGGGIITALAFNIAQFNSTTTTTFKNFTIRLGCTNAEELITWEQNVVETFSPKDVNVSATGWMLHNLDYPYQWDGVSNLVVDVCFYNPSGGNLNSKMMATTTTDYTVLYSTDNLVSVCGQYMVQNKVKTRPNIRFYFCPGTPYAGNVLWSSLSGLSTITDSTASVSPFTSQAADSFLLAVLDTVSGCVARDTVFVPVSDLSAFTTATAAKCNINNGSISVSTAGSYTPITKLWSTGGNAASINGLGPGFYSVQVTDAAGCVLVKHDTVTALPVFVISAFTQGVTCQSSSNGVAGVVLSGGFPPYNVVWSGGLGTNDTLYNLPVGTYLVTVTDSLGCNQSATLIISAPNFAGYTVSSSPSLCNLSTGSAVVLFPQGNAGHTVSWANGTTGVNLSNVPTGHYTFTITDTAGCTVTDSVFVDCMVSVSGVDANSLSVYPNPAKNSFTVLADDTKGNIVVHNELGQRIYETPTRGGEQLINSKDWANGVYYITVTTTEGNVVGRARVMKN